MLLTKMATFSLLSFTIPILLIALFSKPTSSIPLPNTPQFDPNLLLIGDAQSISSPSSVQLTNPKSSSSSGLLIRRKPFKLLASNSKHSKPLSFSTDFTFSISPDQGDGLALIIVRADVLPKFSPEIFGLSREKRFFRVKFYTVMKGNTGDKNANHVGVEVDSLNSVKVSNVSWINLVLNSGIKLHSWVDYDSSSKRLGVRLCEFGSPRPYDPLLAYRIDLGEMWKGEEVLVGLCSSSGNSVQSTSVYSWKFRVRSVPKWLHSKPVNPEVFSGKRSEDKMADKRKLCALRLLSRLIFATGCGLLAAFTVLFLWVVFAKNNLVAVIPMKGSANSEDFRYEKINVILEDFSNDVKK